MIGTSVGKLCGRPLSAVDLEAIRRAVREAEPSLRAEVARLREDWIAGIHRSAVHSLRLPRIGRTPCKVKVAACAWRLRRRSGRVAVPLAERL